MPPWPVLRLQDISIECTKDLIHFPICACHPCAGAMLICSASFQFYRMFPEGDPRRLAENEVTTLLGSVQILHSCHFVQKNICLLIKFGEPV